MKIKISYETVDKMFELCKKLKSRNLESDEIGELLEHKDYQVEIERYNNEAGPGGKFTKEEYIEYFMNLLDIKESEIKHNMLRARYNRMIYFFNNIDEYENKIYKIKNITEYDVKKALERTHFGLPEEIKFEELNIIFSVGLGASEGWFYNNYAHFDLVSFLEESDNIPCAIAHECHHIGLNMMVQELDVDKISPEEYLYLFLAFEGLAVKYCNNGEGVLTKRIYEGVANIGLDKETWKYLSNDFNNTYNNFKWQIEKIRNGKIADMNDLGGYLNDYWMNRYTEGQSIKEVPNLKHSRNYSFGNEVWGLIHDVYGRDKVIYVLKNLKEFPKIFNSALKTINREDMYI